MESSIVAFTLVITASNRITRQSSLYFRITRHLSEFSGTYILLNIHYTVKRLKQK